MSTKPAENPRPSWWPRRMTERAYRAATANDEGLCLACGEAFTEEPLEPDARGIRCVSEDCKQRRVCGVEWALVSGAIELT